MSRVRPPTVHPSCMAKTLTLDIVTQTFLSILFIPTMLISTIDFYHFMPLSLTLTLAGGSQGQRKVKPRGFTFSHAIPLHRMKFDIVLKQFKVNILALLLSKI